MTEPDDEMLTLRDESEIETKPMTELDPRPEANPVPIPLS
jgi:hypothetical protein